jgi:Phage integrase family
LRFFFKVTLKRRDLAEEVVSAREPRRLPVVLSPEEVGRLLALTTNIKHKAALSLAYATGLRSSEVISLKLIDSRDIPRRFQIGSTAHDRHRPVTTLQCCSQLPLLVDQRRACSANDHSRAPAHGRGNGNWFIASPRAATTLSRSGPQLAVTTATPQPIAPSSQIPIAPARTTTVPMPAHDFLP